MKSKIEVLFAVLLLVISSLACSFGNSEVSLANLRMAHDSDGKTLTTTYSTTDVFYAVADLANAPQGTTIEAKWTAVNTVDAEPNLEFEIQTMNITEEGFTGIIYFELLPEDTWPTGQYKVDLYLNGALAQTAEFSVQ